MSSSERAGVWFGVLVILAGLPLACTPREESPGPSYRLVRHFGTSGHGPGEFHRPMGIAVDPAGHLYIADSTNRRVQVFSPDGGYLREFGQATGVALGNPVDVAIGLAGELYVADFDQDRILKLTPQGSLIRSWGGAGSREGQFHAPAGLAVGADGRVYVADFYNHRVQVFTDEGTPVAVLGRAGHGDGELHYPTDVAFDRSGRLLVADAYNHRILGFSLEGRTRSGWGSRWRTALGIGAFQVPTGVAVDGEGRVHVADSGNKRAVLLDSGGCFVAEWNLADDAHPEVYSPTRVATAADRAYFVDTSNDRILILEVRETV